MRLSEVIEKLNDLKKQFGDIPVRCANIDDDELNNIECIQSIWFPDNRLPERKKHIALIEWSD
ncbi:MAG: hypothetical protein IJ187_03050 [Neisseriaceae bacterium]|nr:hypothetical protein [Neisseriaceae bacterium]